LLCKSRNNLELQNKCDAKKDERNRGIRGRSSEGSKSRFPGGGRRTGGKKTGKRNMRIKNFKLGANLNLGVGFIDAWGHQAKEGSGR